MALDRLPFEVTVFPVIGGFPQFGFTRRRAVPANLLQGNLTGAQELSLQTGGAAGSRTIQVGIGEPPFGTPRRIDFADGIETGAIVVIATSGGTVVYDGEFEGDREEPYVLSIADAAYNAVQALTGSGDFLTFRLQGIPGVLQAIPFVAGTPAVSVSAVAHDPVDASAAFRAGVPAVAVLAVPQRQPVDVEIAFRAGVYAPTLWDEAVWDIAGWEETLAKAPAIAAAADATTGPPTNVFARFLAGIPEARAQAGQDRVDGSFAFEAGSPVFAADPVEIAPIDAGVALQAGAPAIGIAAQAIHDGEVAFEAGLPEMRVSAMQDRVDAAVAFRAGMPVASAVAGELAPVDAAVAFRAGEPAIGIRLRSLPPGDTTLAFGAGTPVIAAPAHGDRPVAIAFSSFRPQVAVAAGVLNPVDAALAYDAGSPAIGISVRQDRVDAGLTFQAGAPAFGVVAQGVARGEVAFEAGAPTIAAQAFASWLNATAALRAGLPSVAASAAQDRIDAAVAFEAGAPSAAASADGDAPVELAFEAGSPALAAGAIRDHADAAVSFAAGAPRIAANVIAPGVTTVDASVAFYARSAVHSNRVCGASSVAAPFLRLSQVLLFFNLVLPDIWLSRPGRVDAVVTLFYGDLDGLERDAIEIALVGSSLTAAVRRGVAITLTNGDDSITVRGIGDSTNPYSWNPANHRDLRAFAERIQTDDPVEMCLEYTEYILPTVSAGAEQDRIDATVAFEAGAPSIATGNVAVGSAALRAGVPQVTAAAEGIAPLDLAQHFRAGPPQIAVRAQRHVPPVNVLAPYRAGAPRIGIAARQEPVDVAVAFRAYAPRFLAFETYEDVAHGLFVGSERAQLFVGSARAQLYIGETPVIR